LSATSTKLWLLAYDIACPKRLGSVYRRVKRDGLRLQYSMYATLAHDKRLEALLADIGDMIECTEDDVRAYHVPASCKVWTLGREAMPRGVILDGDQVMRVLNPRTATEEPKDMPNDDDVFLLP